MDSVKALVTKEATENHGSCLKVKMNSHLTEEVLPKRRDGSQKVIGLWLCKGVGGGH